MNMSEQSIRKNIMILDCDNDVPRWTKCDILGYDRVGKLEKGGITQNTVGKLGSAAVGAHTSDRTDFNESASFAVTRAPPVVDADGWRWRGHQLQKC